MAYRSLEEPNRTGEFLLSWSTFGSGEDNNFKESLRLKFVKIPGLSAWLIFDLSLFEQQLLLSLIPSIPVVSSGTMLTPGAMSWWVLITMGTLSFCRDENKVYPKKIPRAVLKQNLNFPVGFKGDMRVTWKICKFKVLLKSHAFQVWKEEALSSNKEIKRWEACLAKTFRYLPSRKRYVF